MTMTLEKRVINLEQMVMQLSLNQPNIRLDRLERLVESNNQAIANLSLRVQNLEVDVQSLKVDVQNLKGSVQNLEVRMQNLEVEVQTLKVDIARLDMKTDKLQADIERLDMKTDMLQANMERLEQKVDNGFKNVSDQISALGSRWGIRNESIWRQTIATILEKSYGAKVESRYLEGDQFDVIIRNGEHILLEITARFRSNDVPIVIRKRNLYTTKFQPPTRFIVAAAAIHSRQVKELEQAGFEVIEPDEDM